MPTKKLPRCSSIGLEGRSLLKRAQGASAPFVPSAWTFTSRLLSLLLLLLGLLLAGCASRLRPLLYDVEVWPTTISPNADGHDDVARISYHIGRNANVSIYFVDQNGERHYFRKARRRSPKRGGYQVYWGGTSQEPLLLENEFGRQLVVSHVLPDGTYTWVVEAVDDQGHNASFQGAITIEDADTTLPELRNFTVMPQIFKPNQDGLRDDWVSISYYLTKDAEHVSVYLVDPARPTVKFPIEERERVIKPGERGYHEYRYEGGVDLGADPPPDGTYFIYGEAEDKVGNRVAVSSTLTIIEGGKPRADVAEGEIDWVGEMNRTVSVPLGGRLCFTATVVNEGPVPIRTSGPWPGQVYKFSENYNTLAVKYNDKSWFHQAGVWRFAINYQSAGLDAPFRWAVGRKEDLERRVIDGIEQWYLLPGKRGLVYGCIEFDEAPPLEADLWWGALIHQDVAVVNNYIDRITVRVGVP